MSLLIIIIIIISSSSSSSSSSSNSSSRAGKYELRASAGVKQRALGRQKQIPVYNRFKGKLLNFVIIYVFYLIREYITFTALVSTASFIRYGDIQLLSFFLAGRGIHQNANVCKPAGASVHISANIRP